MHTHPITQSRASGDNRRRIKVLIVDDSPIMRAMLSRELSVDPDIQVVGTACDVVSALADISRFTPDVVALDVAIPSVGLELPRMLNPNIRAIAICSPSERGIEYGMQALAAGAVDVVTKPATAGAIEDFAADLIRKIKQTNGAKICLMPTESQSSATRVTAGEKVIAIGASTGGVQALTQVLAAFPSDMPGSVIVQHMPGSFTAPFAKKLNSIGKVRVKEAINGDAVTRGCALLAPGGKHMMLRRSENQYFVEVKDGPDIFHQKPSIEILFSSVAKAAGPNAIGAMLTGIGDDGTKGLQQIKNAGGFTIIRDGATMDNIAGAMLQAAQC